MWAKRKTCALAFFGVCFQLLSKLYLVYYSAGGMGRVRIRKSCLHGCELNMRLFDTHGRAVLHLSVLLL